MPHEVEQMVSAGNIIPWHGLGNVIQEAPSIKRGIVLAGLDWKVGTKPLFTEDGVPVPARATYRDDTGAVLGVVGTRYEPLQNADAFEFYEPLIDSGLVTLETAGSLKGGRRIWVLGKINRDPIVIVPQANDAIEQYILLSNSHDVVTAIRCGFTPIRVVCWNTLSWAHSFAARQDKAAGKLLRVRHTKNANRALQEIRDVMDLATATFSASAEQYRTLAAHDVSGEDLQRYVRVVWGHDADDEDACKTVMPRIEELVECGAGNDVNGVRGTWWAAYNGVTEYLTHKRGKDGGKRLDSLWFGSGVNMNRRALEVGLDMATA